jgi:hypothetical protein
MRISTVLLISLASDRLGCGCSRCAPSTAAKAKRQRLGFQIEIKENKTPGDEQCLDPPGAELLAWF